MKIFQCKNCNYKIKTKETINNYNCPKCGVNNSLFEKNKKPIFILVLYFFTIIALAISGYFTITIMYSQNKTSKNNKIKVGTLSMELIEEKDTAINLYDVIPMSDEKALLLKPFIFKLNNNGTYPLIYTLTLENIPDQELIGIKEIENKTRIENNKVKYSLINMDNNKVIKTGLISDLETHNMIEEKISAAFVKKFALRIWIDKNAGNEVQNKFYVGRIILKICEVIE